MMAPEEYGQQQMEQSQQVQQNPCQNYNTYLLQCFKENAGSISICQMNMDMLMQCEKDNTRFFQSM